MSSLATRLGALLSVTACVTVASLSVSACSVDTEAGAPPGGEPGDLGDDSPDGPLRPVDDSAPPAVVPGTGLLVKDRMTVTADLNLRKGPGTSFAVLAVIPSGSVVTLLDPKPQNGFLNIEWSGTAGWSSASFLIKVATTGAPVVAVDGPASPDNAWSRAQAAVGFSYFWGGGAWLAAGASPSTRGACSGSCPSCSHSGSYGADCSGLVAKAWQFGSLPLEVDSHPYSTASFVKDLAGKWSTVSRDALRKGDALVYNQSGSGHIVLYEKGDGWGTPTVIECRGCSYGCVYNARSFASSYKAIRRVGF
jgi:hypothetical protein